MTFARSLARTAVFTALYLGATALGRLTVIDGHSLSLAWPAAGVAVTWFAAQRVSRYRLLDLVALVAATMAIDLATGVPTLLASGFVVANLVQVLTIGTLFARWAPRLWTGGGTERIAHSRDLWRLLAAALVGTGCGAAIGPTVVWLLGGAYSWESTAVWVARNTVSVVAVGVLGLRLAAPGDGTSEGPLAAWWAATWARPRTAAGTRAIELVLIGVLSVLAYLVGFAVNNGLPLAFPLLGVTVWASLRLDTTVVAAHGVLVSAAAILFTQHGYGPFATIVSPPARALVTQAFVALVVVVGLLLALGRDERDALMRQLAAAERSATAQATLLSAVVDSMTEGLSLVDRHGRVTVRNPAALALLGDVVVQTEQLGKAGTYGLFYLDGRPLPDAQTPYVQARDGENVSDVELLLRNPSVPEGRVLSFSATRLDSATPIAGSVMVVFRDVTAERRHRDELASFAGVVAHDLLNPLTAIEGWAETLVELLRAPTDRPPDGEPSQAEPSEAEDGLMRIRRGAVRMRLLINDLLAYTTARDASIVPRPVPLGDVIADIVLARADVASATGAPMPSFEVGPMPVVLADAVLVRQLFDNLIGNAVKYTAMGVTPRVGVTAAPDGEDRIGVEIRDNGIGIPPGQHEAIFGNFHRAHRAGGYAGTGLGLAICKRIVERHGGTIAASDNPDGGSLFVFTLPAAPAPASALAAADRTRAGASAG